MLSLRLVRLLETHSERLAGTLLESLMASPHCSDLRKVPPDHLRARAYEIYRNLSDWLLGRTEGEVGQRYIALGMERAAQGVALSHVVWAIRETKQNLFDFLEHEGISDNPIELYGSLELLTLLDHFFDAAIYHAAVGYERYQMSHARMAEAVA